MKETVLNFGPLGGLVGILTRPPRPSEDPLMPAVVMLNAGVLHRVGPSRVHVRLARALARNGTPSVRIDLPGIGDSRTIDSGGSIVEESLAGIRAAFDFLERKGVAQRFVLFGICSGADHAFLSACSDPRVVGLVVVDPTRIYGTAKAHILRVLRWSLRPVSWWRLLRGRYRVGLSVAALLRRPEAAPTDDAPTTEKVHIESGLRSLAERGVRICYVVTGEGRKDYRYRRQLFDAFPGLGLEPLTTVEMLTRADHTFTREASRVELENVVCDWTLRMVTGS